MKKFVYEVFFGYSAESHWDFTEYSQGQFTSLNEVRRHLKGRVIDESVEITVYRRTLNTGDNSPTKIDLKDLS